MGGWVGGGVGWGGAGVGGCGGVRRRRANGEGGGGGWEGGRQGCTTHENLHSKKMGNIKFGQPDS